MVTAIYRQDVRPPAISSGKTDSRTPQLSTVRIVRITPTTAGRPMRSWAFNGKLAHYWAGLPSVLLVAWTRTDLDVVVDLPGSVADAYDYLCDNGILQARRSHDVAFEHRPERWAGSLRWAERAAREALGARHQCDDLDRCMCAWRGNVLPDVGGRVERCALGRGATQ